MADVGVERDTIKLNVKAEHWKFLDGDPHKGFAGRVFFATFEEKHKLRLHIAT